MIEKACERCGGLMAGSPLKRYCSYTCKRPPETRRTRRACEWCGIDLGWPLKAAKRYCSKECRAWVKGQTLPTVRICKVCDLAFGIGQPSGVCPWCKPRPASMTWHRCVECGAALQGQRGRRAPVRVCERCYGARPARLARAAAERGATVAGDRFSKADIARRDGGRCGLCHRHIDLTLPGTDPMGATIDHIIPISKGGEHSRRNVQIAHRLCNMRKHTNGVWQMRLIA